MEYIEGERVRHPKKPEWGLGQVIENSTAETVTVFFERAGEKKLVLQYVELIEITGEGAASPVLDTLSEGTSKESSRKTRTTCSNCSQPAKFGERAGLERVNLGWCSSCFRQSQRIFSDNVTGEDRYLDELRTIDGIKTPYSAK